jgi:ABC-type antimicrobial peptide transport system permease subunit
MHSFLQDIRYGLRMLAKAPGITLAAIFAFGFGIGANTATFSTANTFLLHPISLSQVDRLAMVQGCTLGQTLARLLSSLLFGVQSNDFTSFFGGALVLVAVVLFACYLPARAATRVDPIIALRYE